MNKQGVVVARDEDLATVEIYNNPNCLTCTKRSKQNGCLSCPDYDDNLSFRVLALNNNGAEIGDKVCLTASKAQKTLLYLISFVIPIVCAVIAYLCLSVFTDDEQIKSKAAVAAVVIAMIFAGLYSYKVSKKICEYKIISIEEDKV